MTIKAGKGSRIFIAEFDFSGEGRSFETAIDADLADSTVFTSAAKEFVAGQNRATVSHAGVWTDVENNWDKWLNANLAPATAKALSLLLGTPTVGDVCCNGELKEARVGRPIKVDDIVAINAEYVIDGALGRAKIIEYEIDAAVGAQTGAGVNLGAASGTEMWLICMHVIEKNGAGTYRIAIQESSDDGADPYALVTQQDFAAAGSYVGIYNGAREAWLRIVTTQTGGTPTAKFLVTVAVVPRQ